MNKIRVDFYEETYPDELILGLMADGVIGDCNRLRFAIIPENSLSIVV
jgi:hypothetical protein